MEDRVAVLLGEATRSEPILEIGPSYNPLVTKADGWNVRVVDHAPKAELEAKYRAWNVDVSRMEEVDFIWTGGSLAAVIPKALHGTFRRVLASHVIEHIPDMVGFLQAASALLDEEGRLALAVPDKRFSFDYYRAATTTGDVLERHERGATQPGLRAAADTYLHMANAGGSIAWNGGPAAVPGLHHGWEMGNQQLERFRRLRGQEFFDLHCSCFTPAGFELIVLELAAMGLCELGMEKTQATGGYEFLAVLNKAEGKAVRALDEGAMQAKRHALLRRTMDEVHEQVELLRAAEAAA